MINVGIFDTAKPKEVKQLKISDVKRQRLQLEIDKLQDLVKETEKLAMSAFAKFQEIPSKETESLKDVLYAKHSIQYWKLHYYDLILKDPNKERMYIKEYKERVEKDKDEVRFVLKYCIDKELVKEVLVM